MKQKYLIIVIALLSFLTISCNSQSKGQEKFASLEDCHQRNLKDSTLMTGWYYMSDNESGFVRQLDKTDESYTINPYPIVTAEDMITLEVKKNNLRVEYLLIKFGKRGTEQWRMATTKAIGGNLALIVDNKLLYTPVVNSEITAGISTLGRMDYSNEELVTVKEAIENDKASLQNKIKEDKAVSENTLNEKWYNNLSVNAGELVETSKQQGVELINGTDCFFYGDNTFKIRLWRYGLSTGFTHEEFGEGTYSYHPETKEIALEFNVKYMPGNQVAMSYYIMKGLSERSCPFIPKDKTIYSRSCLKIIQETDKNRILVELYAYKENGEKDSLGQQKFIREELNNE